MGPKARTVKFYSTVSDRSEVVHLIARLFSTDGGEGSGNFGHAGNPPHVGGSAPRGSGGSGNKAQNKSTNATNNSGTKKPGAKLAEKLRKAFENAENWVPYIDKINGKESKVTIFDKVFNSYALGVFNADRDPEQMKKLTKIYNRYLDVLEENGNPAPKGKTVSANELEKELYSRKKPLSHEERIDVLKKSGFSEDEAESMLSALEEYTSGDWKNVDQKTLESYIEKREDKIQGKLERGIHVKPDVLDKLMSDLKKGVISFDNISSWSWNSATANAFAMSGENTSPLPEDEIPIVFEIPDGHSHSAVSLAEFSPFKEGEALMGANAQFSVVAIVPSTIIGPTAECGMRKGYRVILMERSEEHDKQSKGKDAKSGTSSRHWGITV